MEKDILIDNYIKKIINYRRTHIPNDSFSNRLIDALKEFLSKIIDNKLDFLLTDSFLDYITYHGDIYNNLKGLSGNLHDQVYELNRYFDHLFNDLRERLFASYYTYSDLLDDNLREAIQTILKRYDDYCRVGSSFNFRDLKLVLKTVFSYYVLNKRQENIYDLCDVFLDNIDRSLDGLVVNNVSDVTESLRLEDLYRLIDYVFYKLNNRSLSREIR